MPSTLLYLRDGKVPQDWKRKGIIMIHKGGDKVGSLNCRSVSLMSEKSVKNKWTLFGRKIHKIFIWV